MKEHRNREPQWQAERMSSRPWTSCIDDGNCVVLLDVHVVDSSVPVELTHSVRPHHLEPNAINL